MKTRYIQPQMMAVKLQAQKSLLIANSPVTNVVTDDYVGLTLGEEEGEDDARVKMSRNLWDDEW